MVESIRNIDYLEDNINNFTRHFFVTTDSTGMATTTLTCSTSGGDDHIVSGQDKSSDPASSCDSGKAIVGGQAQPALTYIYNQDNQLLFEGDGTDTTSYAYDANGNLTRKTDPSNNVTTYAYDYENRLTQSLRTGGEAISISFAYDANGNRTSKTENNVTTRYINDPNGPLVQVLQERDGSGNTLASYTYGNDLISQTRSSSTSYYLYDGLGSTRVLTDSSGDILNTYTYEAFGNLVASDIYTPNNYCFTGEQLDSGSNLYYLRARYYDSAVGRFISRDPIGYRGGINLYAYVWNNPVNGIDPSGLCVIGAVREGPPTRHNTSPWYTSTAQANTPGLGAPDPLDIITWQSGMVTCAWLRNFDLTYPRQRCVLKRCPTLHTEWVNIADRVEHRHDRIRQDQSVVDPSGGGVAIGFIDAYIQCNNYLRNNLGIFPQ